MLALPWVRSAQWTGCSLLRCCKHWCRAVWVDTEFLLSFSLKWSQTLDIFQTPLIIFTSCVQSALCINNIDLYEAQCAVGLALRQGICKDDFHDDHFSPKTCWHTVPHPCVRLEATLSTSVTHLNCQRTSFEGNVGDSFWWGRRMYGIKRNISGLFFSLTPSLL